MTLAKLLHLVEYLQRVQKSNYCISLFTIASLFTALPGLPSVNQVLPLRTLQSFKIINVGSPGMKQRWGMANLLKSMGCKEAAREECSFLFLLSPVWGCFFYFKLVLVSDGLNEVFNMPTEQQTLFPLRIELAGGLESARISRVKALRKDVISNRPKDDKLLLDVKIKWLSLSSFGSESCQHSRPGRMLMLKVLLLILKVLIHLLESRNIFDGVGNASHLIVWKGNLVGLLELRKAPKHCFAAIPVVPPCSDTFIYWLTLRCGMGRS